MKFPLCFTDTSPTQSTGITPRAHPTQSLQATSSRTARRVFRVAVGSIVCSGLVCSPFLPSASAQTTPPAATTPSTNPPTPPPKFKAFNEVVKGTVRYDGLFTLYRTNDTLYAEIKPGQM